MERGVPIRAISRGLSVLTTVNRDGPISMMDIARAAQVPYPTACRIIQTLLHEGMVEKEPHRKRYRVTSLVQTLSTGYQTEDMLVSAAREHIETLCQELSWPISIATRVGTRMMVRDSTHKMTSLTFSHYFPGYTLPIAECATGKVHLAFCDDEEREAILEGLKAIETESSHMGLVLMGDDYMLTKIRKDGYAMQIRNVYNADPGKTSSIAVPLFDGNDQLIGSLALIFFASAMNGDEAVAKYLKPMQDTARAIGSSMRAATSAAA
ncbi:IclR family transcriptional regulator domain-containing protein [Altererythrobacter lutimaris]|uniref:Helix-turn-helix domain-containing protein n=1 Tax=Altererythrobacter lutimaris TaxID=2743979 RepID=A0A850H6L2_9SPHN|nr:IclR family transcriptional regulator C-terminal domain-containing protein [Altererythrobacter lutimaris]NVE93473.1 helix-turn-helix domain-containing protein [Altererythrobacter lutimaris]